MNQLLVKTLSFREKLTQRASIYWKILLCTYIASFIEIKKVNFPDKDNQFKVKTKPELILNFKEYWKHFSALVETKDVICMNRFQSFVLTLNQDYIFQHNRKGCNVIIIVNF